MSGLARQLSGAFDMMLARGRRHARALQVPMKQIAFAAVILLATAGPLAQRGAAPQTPASGAFRLEETTIVQIHAAMKAGTLTCHALVDLYLARIDALDKKGPAINAIVLLNPEAMQTADDLDARFKIGGLTGPLHCIPVIVKDNYETKGLRTTAGSKSLQNFIPTRDAFVVKKLRDAGAIVLAKSNMAEFAFSPYETVSSILPGWTFNPYALNRSTAGSSGGSAAAVASNFGAVSVGTDTGNSIRGPSSHQSLVGIRSTMGLVSRSGIVPLSMLADIAGPITRTVEDAVAMLQVIAGEDPDDPITLMSNGHIPPSYAAFLKKDGLKGARIGVLHDAYERGNQQPDPDIVKVFEAALADLKKAGAEIIDPAKIDGLPQRTRGGGGQCHGFKYDLEHYLAGAGAPVHTLDEIIKIGGVTNLTVQQRLQQSQTTDDYGDDSAPCVADREYRQKYGAAVVQTMDTLKIDAFVYPTWSNVPRLIGDLTSPAGDNSQVYSPTTGFPAINVPMGYTRNDTLPIGMTIYGRPWDEGTLIRLAYAYEQATHHRRSPPLK
jgi:Asp-tRNA(Asn)/Glu-tRNA(Gln) amidotransferase A subunit family amidase